MSYPENTLLGLPTELRLEIYKHTFTSRLWCSENERPIGNRCHLTYDPATNMLFADDTEPGPVEIRFSELATGTKILRTCTIIRDELTDTLFAQLVFSIRIKAHDEKDDRNRIVARADKCGLMKQIRKVDVFALLFDENRLTMDITHVRNLLKHLQYPGLQAKLNIGLVLDPDPELLSEFWQTHYDIFKKEIPELQSRCEVELWSPNALRVKRGKRVVETLLDIIYGQDVHA